MAKEIYKNNIPVFEQIKRIDENGNEYWSARDLNKVVEYAEYRHFLSASKRAKESIL